MRIRRWSIDPQRIPWSLWAFVALMGVGLIVLFARATPVKPAIFGVVVLGAWAYFLLRGVRWLWIVTVVYLAAFLAFDLATASGTWFGDASGLVQLMLLVLPATRRFFTPRKSPTTA